jgi:hypothetical protein
MMDPPSTLGPFFPSRWPIHFLQTQHSSKTPNNLISIFRLHFLCHIAPFLSVPSHHDSKCQTQQAQNPSQPTTPRKLALLREVPRPAKLFAPPHGGPPGGSPHAARSGPGRPAPGAAPAPAEGTVSGRADPIDHRSET